MVLRQLEWAQFSRDNLSDVREAISNCLGEQGVSEDTIDAFKLAIDEAVSNIVMHGYRGSPGYLSLVISLDDEQVIIDLRDKAPLFDVKGFKSHIEPMQHDHLQVGGFGVQLIKSSVDEIRYSDKDGQNHLQLIKNI